MIHESTSDPQGSGSSASPPRSETIIDSSPESHLLATRAWAKRLSQPQQEANLIFTGQVGNVHTITDSANVNLVIEIDVRFTEKGRRASPASSSTYAASSPARSRATAQRAIGPAATRPVTQVMMAARVTRQYATQDTASRPDYRRR